MTSPRTAPSALTESTPVSRREGWILAALTAAFVSLVAFWCVFTPQYDAPDEPQHLNSAIRLAQGGGWPSPGDAEIQNAVLGARSQAKWPATDRTSFADLQSTMPGYDGVDQMTQHPPLYYAYIGTVLNVIGYEDIRSDFALLAARLAGLIFVLPLPFLVWNSVRRITRSPKAAIIGAASLFAVPQLAHIMGSVSNDGATIALCSAVIWLAIRAMTGDTRWRVTVGMGLALGLALLTKGTAVPLFAFAAIVLMIWPRSLRLGHRVLRAAVAMSVALMGGWWWIRNLLVYGTLQPSGLQRPSAEWPDGSSPNARFFADRVWSGVSNSFWGNFGWLNHPMPLIITDVLTVICIAIIVGYAFRRHENRGPLVALAILPIFFLVSLLTVAWPTYLRTQLPAGLQGRYLFVVIVALIVLSAVAWMNFVPRERFRTAGVSLIAVFAAIAAIGLLTEFFDAYTGFGDLFTRSPLGTIGTSLLALLTLAVCATALVMTMRFVRSEPDSDRRIDQRATVGFESDV